MIRGRFPIRRFFVGVVLGILCFTLPGCDSNESDSNETPQPDDVAEGSFEDQWGICDCRIMLSAADYMLDFRYHVTDVNKAAPILDENVKPHLVHSRTGAKLIVPTPPKVGALRQSPDYPAADKTYFILFANPGRLVKRGDKVDVVVGDFKAEDLVVE